MTYDEVVAALRARYPERSWAFFEQVRNGTGYGANRTADAIAMGLWPSQGLELHGFEIKCYRGDWLRELKKPQKADEMLGYCDRIYIVVSDRGMVKPEELPPTWGLMEPAGDGLRATVKAERNPAAVPLDRSFIASVMREAARVTKHRLENNDAARAAFDSGWQKRDQMAGQEQAQNLGEMKRLRESIAAFEKASGVVISSWNSGEIGRVVAMVLRQEHLNIESQLRGFKVTIDRAIEEIDTFKREAGGGR